MPAGRETEWGEDVQKLGGCPLVGCQLVSPKCESRTINQRPDVACHGMVQMKTDADSDGASSSSFRERFRSSKVRLKGANAATISAAASGAAQAGLSRCCDATTAQIDRDNSADTEIDVAKKGSAPFVKRAQMPTSHDCRGLKFLSRTPKKSLTCNKQAKSA